jgi:hypothetical protein
MRKKPRAIIGWTLAAVWLLTLPAAAVEYRFQVTNLDYLTFTSYLETDSPARRDEEAMRRLETRLNTTAFPASAVLPGRQVQLLEDPSYGGSPRPAGGVAHHQQSVVARWAPAGKAAA